MPQGINRAAAGAAVDLTQPEVHAVEGSLYSSDHGERIPIRRHTLIKLQSALVVFPRTLNLILLLRQPPDSAGVREHTFGARLVSICELRLFAVPKRIPATFRLLERFVGAIDITETVHID